MRTYHFSDVVWRYKEVWRRRNGELAELEEMEEVEAAARDGLPAGLEGGEGMEGR